MTVYLKEIRWKTWDRKTKTKTWITFQSRRKNTSTSKSKSQRTPGYLAGTGRQAVLEPGHGCLADPWKRKHHIAHPRSYYVFLLSFPQPHSFSQQFLTILHSTRLLLDEILVSSVHRCV